jgi:hypothetical protein
VVVARANPVEHRRLDLDAQGLAGPLGNGHRELDAASHDVELDVGGVGRVLPLDHIAGPETVDAADLVARLEARPLPGRTRRDSDHAWLGHSPRRLSGRSVRRFRRGTLGV